MTDVLFERCSSCGAEKPYVRRGQIDERCEAHRSYAGFPGDCGACRAIAGLPTQIAEEIAKLRAHASRCVAEAARLSTLVGRYSDLKMSVGRWNKIAYCALSANPRVDRFDVRHNCGCCSDSPLEIWPYVEEDRVYSVPARFIVGNKDEYGDVPREGWDAEMRAAGIPEAIVGAVGRIFERRREAMLAEAEYLREEAGG